VWKFADDIKLIGPAGTADQVGDIQIDLDKLVNWASVWQMSFNFDKCKVMHLGYNAASDNVNEYRMGGHVLDVIEEEKDLGVIISNDLKVEKQCAV